MASFIEAVTLSFIKPYTYITTSYFYDLLLFIPISFVFEIIFDFFHYITHRTCHNYSTLYYYIHKKHHKYPYPTAIIAFYQDFFDFVLTNSLRHKRKLLK